MAVTEIAGAKQAAVAMKALDRAKIFWAGRDKKQRVYLGLGLVLTLGTLAAFGQMMSTPEYKPLMTGLEPADVQAISTQLAAKKIAFQVSPDGTSMGVAADQVDAARMEVSSHDAPHSGRLGFEIFDKVSWGQTEFDEKVNYQRALEGELERTIQTISNVKTARVHLVMATDSVFMDRERGAKASVTLRLKRGSLSREEVTAITRLVAGAVDELKPADVVILDADSNQALGANSGIAGGTDEVEQTLTRRLMATLAPVVGASRLHTTVNVEYETGSSEESQEKYDPSVTAPLNIQKTEESIAAGAVNGGVPGTSSNVAGAKAGVSGAVGKDGSQSSKTESATYGVNHTTRHVIEPAGRIRRLTAAVVVDDILERRQEKGKWVETYKKRSAEELKMIGDLAQAAIGFNSTRGDVMSVQNLGFDRGETVDVMPLKFLDKARKGMSDYSPAIRYAALLALFGLVYALMLRPVQKRALALPPPMLINDVLAGAAELEQPAMPDRMAMLTQKSLLLKNQLVDFVEAEPESSTVAVRAWLRDGAK